MLHTVIIASEGLGIQRTYRLNSHTNRNREPHEPQPRTAQTANRTNGEPHEPRTARTATANRTNCNREPHEPQPHRRC